MKNKLTLKKYVELNSNKLQPTTNVLSPISHTNSNSSITPNYSKNKAATNSYQHQKEMPNPPLNINLRLPKQIIRECIEEEKKKSDHG